MQAPWAPSNVIDTFRRQPAAILVGAMPVAIAGALAGTALATHPMIAVVLLIALCVASYAVVFNGAVPGAFLKSLGVVLLGYACLGRSFAYLGSPPFFIGELMLAFAIVAALASGSLLAVARSPVTWLIIVLAACGAVQTIPYLGPYGLDAFRDAALWGYGGFALAVAACLLSTDSLPAAVSQYGRWLTPFVIWAPAALILGRVLGADAPSLPGTGLPIFNPKAGDAAVHLAGAAAFVLLGLDSATSDIEKRQRSRRRMFWALWVVCVLCVTALNRGGFVAVTAAMVVLMVCEPAAIGRRLVVSSLVAIVAMAVVVLVSANLEDRPQSEAATDQRSLSLRQVADNVLSISGLASRANLDNTREWRLDWWSRIFDYTVFGEYFWTGKGFGVNLADDDGFQVASEDQAPLRSPHNAFMTVLARTGVPGAVFWTLLQACFAVSLVRARRRAQRVGAWWWARLDLWILSYWAAFLVNASFDVFLEGPHGGIWFWCLIGAGIAVLESQRRVVPGGRRGWLPA